MMGAVLLITILSTGQVHVDDNPVYRALLQQGVFECKEPGFLPPPTMVDGLDAGAQRKVIDTLAKPRHSFATLTRKSVVAPHIVKIEKVDSGDSEQPLLSIQFWFIAHADLEALQEKDFLDSLLTAGDGDSVTLQDEELAERNIKEQNKERESYGQIVFPLLKKVRLHATGRSYWSNTPDSILTAAAIDPRFAGDNKYPNQWEPLDREGNVGAAKPYTGAGLYMKITRLEKPAKTVFVECHIRGVEPQGWFKGTNLLTSKLPPAIQSQVRTVRREMMKAR